MDFNDLFLSLDGRIHRVRFWVGAVILLAIWFIIDAIFGNSTLAVILVTLVTLALFYPSYAVAAKRFQDRDKPGQTALYGLIPLLVASLLQNFGLTGTPEAPNALAWICRMVTLGVGIWFLVELGILKGTTGSNRYGPDPLAGQ